MVRPIGAYAAVILSFSALAGCEPTYTNHGFAPQLSELASIEAGADTKGSVIRKLGRPSTLSSFEADSWYYDASRVERFAFYAPKVIDRTVVAVRFDSNGLVQDVARYGLEDGKIINLVTRRTPTYGRELSVLQQIFGNIGRFNANQAAPAGSGSRRPGG